MQPLRPEEAPVPRAGRLERRLQHPDDLPEHLSEPPAVRVTGPDWGRMSFAAFGANLLIALNPCFAGAHPKAPPSLIYSTETSALTIGPRLPDDHVCNLDNAVAAGGKLYAISWVFNKDSATFSDHWQILGPTGSEDLWDPSHAWSWLSKPITPPVMNREAIVCHALHPDGRTIFISTESKLTYTLDTGGNGECKELREWVPPFSGQAPGPLRRRVRRMDRAPRRGGRLRLLVPSRLPQRRCTGTAGVHGAQGEAVPLQPEVPRPP